MIQTSAFQSSRWQLTAALVGIFAAFLCGAVAWSASAPTSIVVGLGALGGLAFGGFSLAFGHLDRKLQRLYRQTADDSRQITSWINVRPLLGDLPVSVGGWAMDPLFAEMIALTILREKPRRVLECGSGSSTALIAACLAQVGGGRVVSLDHDAQFAEQTRRLLETRTYGDRATVLTTPLTEMTVEGQRVLWYGVDASDLPEQVDMLVVDGPPGPLASRARFPAVPVLLDRLAPDCVILMDDGDRPDERWVARRWGQQLLVEPEYIPGGKGGWILRRSAAASLPGLS
jgi:predicted O-methyltransferase YrrM